MVFFLSDYRGDLLCDKKSFQGISSGALYIPCEKTSRDPHGVTAFGGLAHCHLNPGRIVPFLA